MIMEGFARRFLALRAGKNQTEVRFTDQESIAVAQVEPPNFEMTRAGRRFWLGNTAGATGIAPVQAVPTTAAQWVIWNADPSATYFFEELGMFLTSGTPGLGGTLWGALFQTPAQLGANATGMTATSMSTGGRASRAIVKSGVTVTQPAAPTWYPLMQSIEGITAAAFSTGYGMTFERRDIGGAIAIQPGQGLALAVLGPTGTTPLFAPFARWVEQETDME
jgi:hypothetical protein